MCWVALARPLLDGIAYGCIFEEPSALETYAIFVNVLELDAEGVVLNAKQASGERRSTSPPFEEWELALH